MGPQIRKAEPSDVAGIFHVRTSVNENLLSVDELTAMGITRDTIATMIEDGTCAWVATEGEAVVGFSMIDPDEGSLFAAFVLPSHEGAGLGRKLVSEAEKQLFEHHAVAWLETGKATRAAGFYRRLGWGNERDIGGGDIRLEKKRNH